MIERLLPASVVTVEAIGPAAADPGAEAGLYPEERAVITKAVDKRRREFATVRACARQAMEKLGVPPRPILPGERGAPGWPEGVRGSMTHCAGYCAAALVRTADLASLGIDAEPHDRLPEGVQSAIALPSEEERLAALTASRPGVHWDRLLFSAKESVYKAWFPLTGKWLDFSEADITLTPVEETFGTVSATLLVPGPVVAGREVGRFEGHWMVRDGLLATAIAIPYTS
ncbi:4'-phosphopantetheinyl transferase family protein [Streptomyces acidiscabies]|uniref:4'-phosphopantetheinyl transferase n=1 Tax=Streptomyces acidiscabies TaxID=42234 RepID=A0A0L0JFZ8_9ACTN|nr:4'-phosphopantetheinyl transferase superfamily protein [Streptomyces acidiscabies]KND24642.1 4'-phosphopantetheinyl transferase [Streptomyces acidiscabies]